MSSGQPQLTLNCLALELEHLDVPKGLEEWSTEEGKPPPAPHPSETASCSRPLPDVARFPLRNNNAKSFLANRAGAPWSASRPLCYVSEQNVMQSRPLST